MKAIEGIALASILFIAGLALLPGRKAEPPKSYFAPEQQKMHRLSIAMLHFEYYEKRFPSSMDELRSYAATKKKEIILHDSDLVFTFPDGSPGPWLITPTLLGRPYLLASPEFTWSEGLQQLTVDKDARYDILKIYKSPE